MCAHENDRYTCGILMQRSSIDRRVGCSSTDLPRLFPDRPPRRSSMARCSLQRRAEWRQHLFALGSSRHIGGICFELLPSQSGDAGIAEDARWTGSLAAPYVVRVG